ncbi:MAG: TlpA family protein disulfide reductase [Nitrospirae bacterium]|nr:TlpA family protein disulfide reductase [Nitrospirota bacterium]
MKKAALLMLLLLGAAAVVQLSSNGVKARSRELTEGSGAPGFTVYDKSGKAVSLEQLKGKVVVLNFWATWCPSCVEEAPTVQRLYEQQKANPNLKLVTVLTRDSMDSAISFMAKSKFDFPVATDKDNKAAKAYGLTGVPETYLIDKRGILFRKIIGPIDWDSKPAQDLIAELLKGGN